MVNVGGHSDAGAAWAGAPEIVICHRWGLQTQTLLYFHQVKLHNFLSSSLFRQLILLLGFYFFTICDFALEPWNWCESLNIASIGVGIGIGTWGWRKQMGCSGSRWRKKNRHAWVQNGYNVPGTTMGCGGTHTSSAQRGLDTWFIYVQLLSGTRRLLYAVYANYIHIDLCEVWLLCFLCMPHIIHMYCMLFMIIFNYIHVCIYNYIFKYIQVLLYIYMHTFNYT